MPRSWLPCGPCRSGKNLDPSLAGARWQFSRRPIAPRCRSSRRRVRAGLRSPRLPLPGRSVTPRPGDRPSSTEVSHASVESPPAPQSGDGSPPGRRPLRRASCTRRDGEPPHPAGRHDPPTGKIVRPTGGLLPPSSGSISPPSPRRVLAPGVRPVNPGIHHSNWANGPGLSRYRPVHLWRLRGSNPRPSLCKSDALPLS